MQNLKGFWDFAYLVWPPCIRTAEALGFHDFRQKFLLGHLNSHFNKESLENFLVSKGFEPVLIAWRDPGEVMSLRRIDKGIFQHHIRLFVDGEIRAHYEYSPEARPFDHFWEALFKPETEFFKKLLGEYLVAN